MPLSAPLPAAQDDAGKKTPLRKFSWDEIAKHKHTNDCWIVVKGKVYDVTSWVPNHPGGRMILHGGGRESTAMFVSYHPLYVQKKLEQYLIGEVNVYNPYYTWDESDFYPVLKQRVETFMKAQKLSREPLSMYLKSMLVFALWCVFYYLAMIKGSIPLAIVFGFVHAHLGISIGHDGCHGSYSKNRWVNKAATAVMDLMGGSSIVWWLQHNIGHHPNSNRQGDKNVDEFDQFDPDVRSGSPIIRLNPEQAWAPHQRFQHLYIWLLFPVVGLKWYINDVKAIVRRKYNNMDFFEITNYDVVTSLACKFFFLLYAVVVPAMLHHPLHTLILMVLFYSTASYTFCMIFATNHLTENALFPDDSVANRDWASLQVLTTSNYAVDSPLWAWLSGALNFQVEHHLFPGINHMHLPKISPIVQQTCKEYNIPYSCYPTYLAAITAYYNHLWNLGRPLTAGSGGSGSAQKKKKSK